jgi:hypothetical protein
MSFVEGNTALDKMANVAWPFGCGAQPGWERLTCCDSCKQ